MGGMQALLSRTTLAGLETEGHGDEHGQRTFDARFGYGLPAFGGRFTATPEMVLAAAEAIERGAFTEERAQAVTHLAEEVQREAGHQSRGCMVLALHGEPDNVLFEVMVRARTGEALDLNEEFADRIVANEELMSDPGRNFVLVFIGTKTDDSDTRATP